MITIEKFKKLQIGDTLCDMHYPLREEDLQQGLKIKSRTQEEREDGAKIIESKIGRMVTNKMAVLVSIHWNGDRVFNYNYDGRYFGVIVISLCEERKQTVTREIKITFQVSGYIEQIVELSDDYADLSDEEIASKLELGEFVTTINEPGTIESQDYTKQIGRIVSLDNNLEYEEFEVEPYE